MEQRSEKSKHRLLVFLIFRTCVYRILAQGLSLSLSLLLFHLCSRALNREHGTSSRKLNVAQRSTGRNIAISSSYMARRLCKLSRSVLQYLGTLGSDARVSKVSLGLPVSYSDSAQNTDHESRNFVSPRQSYVSVVYANVYEFQPEFRPSRPLS